MSHRNNPARLAVSGVIAVDKPVGISSMAAVAHVRRKAGGARTGHGGTLDPLASGVLVLALGRATKIIDRLMATTKRYRTEIDLSAFTTTDDREGERLEVPIDEPPDIDAVREALHCFEGIIEQRPPDFSAVKVDGRRAYALARGGAAAVLPVRSVHVFGISLLRYAWPIVELDVHCGKGTYIRSIARDLGQHLGTGGHCSSIRRTAVGPFTIEMAEPLERIPEPLTERNLMTVEQALHIVQGDAAASDV